MQFFFTFGAACFLCPTCKEYSWISCYLWSSMHSLLRFLLLYPTASLLLDLIFKFLFFGLFFGAEKFPEAVSASCVPQTCCLQFCRPFFGTLSTYGIKLHILLFSNFIYFLCINRSLFNNQSCSWIHRFLL